MNAIRSLFLVTLCAIGLAGCGNLPPLNFSVPTVNPSPTRLDADLRAVTVTAAQSGEATGPLPIDSGTLSVWKEALQEALTRAAIFNDDSRRRVSLQVKLLQIDVPAAGISFTTRSEARYDLIDRATGAVLFTSTIQADGTTPADFAFVGLVRARESVNRSVQANIVAFLRALEGARLSTPVTALP